MGRYHLRADNGGTSDPDCRECHNRWNALGNNVYFFVITMLLQNVTALALALGTVTSFIKVIHMPMGGSVTFFSMLFIALVGYWYGLGPGLMTGFAFGILQMVIDPYIISVPQMLIDYVFAFTALGLSGCFVNAKKFGLVKGYVLAVLGRYVFAVISGWVFFGMYAGDYGYSSGFVYSLVYNILYLGIEGAITVIVLFLPPVRKAMEYVKRLAKS